MVPAVTHCKLPADPLPQTKRTYGARQKITIIVATFVRMAVVIVVAVVVSCS